MVYLIHFDQPYRHAKHYIGWSRSRPMCRRRLDYHRRGRGSRLMDAVTKAGIGWAVVRIWANADRHFERKLKNRGGAARICPVCQGKKVRLRAPYWRYE